MNFLFDQDLSWRLAEIVNIIDPDINAEAVGHNPCRLAGGTLDEGVLQYVGANDQILISKDQSQLGDKSLVELMLKYGVRAVYVTKSIPESDPRLQAIWLLENWPKLKEQSSKLKPGQAIKVKRDGTFHLVTVRIGS